MPPPERRTVDYPLLGEPEVVEFVNTLYVDPDGVTDYLATVDLARGWFGAVRPAILVEVDVLDESARRMFVTLRDAIRSVFDRSDVATNARVLESAVNASPGRLSLVGDDDDRLIRRTVFDATSSAGAASFLADAAITIVTAPDPRPVLVCDRPACNMRYFQHHRRRRYCNTACADSDRQSRFQQRQKN